MANEIILAVIVIAVFVALRYIIKAKAKGQHCIGCSEAGSCTKCHCAGKE